ncbi:MAG TPA: heme lyase CcmF/NrfE family subunit [Acidimicrobiales bacterium]|nr:heme lyase CcmF/NrfE family subunit [Acidimicrobiales bacterium]
MNAIAGQIGVALGLVSAICGVGVLIAGIVGHRPQWLRAGPRAAWGLLAGALLATAAMEHALITHDFSLAYVADNNARATPLLYSITGMWAALQGSILLWALVLSGYVAVMARRFRNRASDPLVAWALLVALVVAAFFFGLMAGPANPFVTISGHAPADGLGPNALLQDNVLIAFHPVFLYLGFVGFTVPFAFAVAALVTGRLGEGWLIETRRYTLFAWAFLTVGIVMGAWWSYQVLGWGGFWAWDPVENAALLPWLCATAYLHSVMVQERRGLLRVWNLSLLIAAFSLTILGTFLTRSGVLVSVHAFADSSAIGPSLLGLFGAVVACGVGLIFWRGEQLRSPGSIDSPVSREGAFLVNNLLFAAFAVVVLIGTVFPLFVQALDNQQITVGTPYFDSMTVPLGFALLFFMAIGPVLPWRKAGSGLLRSRLALPAWAGVLVVAACVIAGVRGFTPLSAFGLAAVAGASALRQLVLASLAARRSGLSRWRAFIGRSNGGMIVHLGVVIVAVGLTAATSFGHRATFELNVGQTVSYEGHRITYGGASDFSQPNRSGVIGTVYVDGAPFHPAISNYPGYEGIGSPAVDSSVRSDVYLTISGVSTTGKGQASIGVVYQPMVMWLWIGGVITAVGALLAAVPGPSRRRRVPGHERASEDDQPDESGGDDDSGVPTSAAGAKAPEAMAEPVGAPT